MSRHSRTRRPRLAVVTDAIAPFHYGGKESRYDEIVTRLAHTYDIDVYTMRWWSRSQPASPHSGVRYRAVCPAAPMYKGGRRSILQAVLFAVGCSRLLITRWDVLEVDHMPFLHLFTLKLIALIRRRMLFVTWHEVWGPNSWKDYLGPFGRIAWMIELVSMRLPDHIFAASKHTADELRPWVRSRTAVTVAPNGIDRDRIRTAPRVEPFDVVVVGRLISHKRVDMILDGLALLRDRGTALTAHIVGQGPDFQLLQEKRDELQLDGLVEFTGALPKLEHVYSQIVSARVLVLASAREGFGIAALEGLAAGLSVVTVDSPKNAARFLAYEVPNGYVSEPTPEALSRAIETAFSECDAKSPKRLDEWLEQFTWKRCAETIKDALDASVDRLHIAEPT